MRLKIKHFVCSSPSLRSRPKMFWEGEMMTKRMPDVHVRLKVIAQEAGRWKTQEIFHQEIKLHYWWMTVKFIRYCVKRYEYIHSLSPTLSFPVSTFLKDSRIIWECHHLCSQLLSIFSVTKSLVHYNSRLAPASLASDHGLRPPDPAQTGDCTWDPEPD